MKKNLIKQAKKSMSLFLAVLMLLSCWVWVAPDEAKKAEAAEITLNSGYTVEINWTISVRNCDGGDIKYKTYGNGWEGPESSEITALQSMSASNMTAQGTYTYSWTTDKFPTVVKITTKGGFVVNNPSRCQVNYIKINGKTVYNGGEGKVAFNLPTWNSSASGSAEAYPNYTDADPWGTSGNLDSGYSWPRPHIAGFVDSSATANDTKPDDINITLNKVGGSDVEKSTNFDINKYTLYDQYGVKASDYIKNNGKYCNISSMTTYVAGTANSDDAAENTDIWSKGDGDQTVVVSPNLQISDPQSSDGKAEYYLVRKYVLDDGFGGTPTSKVSAKVNVTYPDYTVNFNSGLTSAKITADKEYTGTYSPSKYHGGNITLPSKTEAAGYTFYGYWTKPQPASGNASYNALEADFAKPCSTEDYNAYKATGTVNGDIVTDTDGNKWYDAGKALDPTTAKTIDVSENYANFVENWYGWWISDDISVKFYDVDGSFLGDKVVKSGQTQSAVTWPASKYINSGYTTGAFKFKVDANIWENVDGTEINKNSHTFTKDLILTPKLTREAFTDKYAVAFINPNNGNSVAVGTDGNYAYRADIKSYADTALGKIPDTPSDVDGALDYSYELLGWTTVKPTTGNHYHVLLEDADFDVNGTSIGLNSDWVVRQAATYYAVYRRHVKTYVVNFNYKDATGADATRQLKVKYGATLTPPTEYVPYTYVTKGFGYTFDKWAYTTDDGDALLDYAATIPFTSENISIAGAALEGSADLEPIAITATYGAPVATPYTVTFNYKDDEGKDDTSIVEVKNEQFILQSTVNNLKSAEYWDDGESQYEFANMWEITEGAATVGIGGTEKKVGDIISTDDLISLTPTSNIAFKAYYINPVPFYTVTYNHGAKTESFRVLENTNVPEWTNKVTNDNGTPDDKTDDFVEDKIYVPEDYEGDGGTYVFQGWYDAKQTDETFKATNGNKITTADKVTGNLNLYAQFKFVPDTFEIKFMSYDGKVQLSAGKFEKGESIEGITAEANVAAQGRASDDTYDYLFLGWDKPVPTFCEGQAVTFTAQYKPVYRYYNVKWYNSKLVNGKWVADKTTAEVDGKDVETYLLATTHHTYNSKLYSPAVDNLTCLETAPAGQNYVFAGWYYDVNGEAVKYERGMLITEEMEFYATYTLTDKLYTVTTVVKGEETKYDVAAGQMANISDPQAGYVNATKHDAFAGWYTDAECTDGNEFDIDNTAINTDTKIYAKFEESDHEFTNKAVKDVPTYYEKGTMEKWCSCDEAQTKTEEDIAMLTDSKIPTGTIYLGDKSWSSEGEPAYNTDNDPISIFVNEDTDVIITSNDTGDENAQYNPSGTGIGVKYIRAFAFPAETVLTAQNYGAAQQLAIDVYVDESETLTNNANFAVKLGDFVVADLDADGNVQYENGEIKYKRLESGESYIIYYYVTDKAGNQLNRKVRTAKFLYDTTAPAFAVEGKSNGATVPTYCGEAAVTGLEKNVVLTVNGEVVTATYAEGAATGTYKIKYAEGMDNVIITATDKAGNTYSKKIKVADHSWLVEEVKSTCTEAGYKRETCNICKTIKTNEEYEVTGHVMGQPVITPADCVNNGYAVTKCENCDYEIKAEFEEDGTTPLFPALGHVYEKDENDETVYTTVTVSTCKTNGTAEAVCTDCGEGKIEKVLALDPENHEDITETEVDADCVNNGYYKKYCSCGETLVSKDHITDPEIYAAKGHGETAWEVIKEENCYQPGTKVEKCTVCTDIITEETAYGYTEDAEGEYAYVTVTTGEGEDAVEEKVTEKIDGKTLYKYYLLPATGKHVKVLANPDTYEEDGVVKYKCATEGCPYEYKDKVLKDEELETYDITFLAEDGKTVIQKVTAEKGTYVAADAVAAPAKAATKEYKYSFAGWVEVLKDKDGKVSDGATYKLPLEVSKDMTLKASYKGTKILYKHTFYVPTEWTTTLATDEIETVVYATLQGGYGDERVPSGIPVFTHKDPDEDARLKKLYTFEFKGWKNANGVLVTNFAIEDNADFTAYFEAVPVEYEVIFYNGNKVIHTSDVVAGASAVYNNYDNKGTEDTADDELIVPEKAYDDENHYTFSKWYTDAECTVEYKGAAITEKTRLYAGYTSESHGDKYVVNNKVGTVVPESDPEVKDGIVQKATCTLPELTEMICSVCGHTKQVETKAALGHDMATKQETDENGIVYTVTYCKRCGEETEKEKSTVIITFKHENGDKNVEVEYNLNADITYDVVPEKAADAEYTYTFEGWYLDGVKVESFGKADAAKTFVAKYTSTTRKYIVSYIAADLHTVLKSEEVEYGAVIPAAPADPEKASTENDHFTFTGWNVPADTTVTGDMEILPVFESGKHEFVKTGETAGATCTTPGGDVYKCTGCDKTKASGGSPATGHKFRDIVEQKAATYEEAGYIIRKCANCSETETEVLPQRQYKYIKVTVKDAKGNPVEGAKVDLYRDGTWLTSNKSNAEGKVTFKVGDEDYKYTVLISGVEGLENKEFDVSAGEEIETNGGGTSDNSCTCSCHRPGFWGIVFRFFHKIISWFAGRIICCSCPDEAY